MNLLRKRKDFWYYVSGPFSIGALILILGFLVKGVIGIYEKERVSREQFRMTEENYREYAERETFLRTEIERLQSPKGIEQEVREKFRVAKEDEKLVVIVEPDYTDIPRAPSEGANVWSAIKGFFVGH